MRGSGTNELKVRVPQTSSHPSWDDLSSEVQCQLNMEGLYFHPIPFHFIPALERGKRFELVDRACHTYMYFAMFQKAPEAGNIICIFL